MRNESDFSQRDLWARLRFSIVGNLLAAPPNKYELHQALKALSVKTWRHPVSGEPVTFGTSTIERWFYTARNAPDPVAALRPGVRADAGMHRILPQTIKDALQAQYTAHPGWSYQLHFDNLAVLIGKNLPLPSYATVRRYMMAQGMKRQAGRRKSTPGAKEAAYRLDHFEVRSYEVEHVNALWHADFHDGSRYVLTQQGWVQPQLLGVLDDHSRLVCHAQWYLAEDTECFIHGLSQAFQKRGLPRALMTDRGGAMLARETQRGLHDLSILHEPTLPYSAYQNAKQEVFWSQVEGRLMAMIEGEKELTLKLLNEATQAWVEQEYNRKIHSEIGSTPLERFIKDRNVGRECPGSTHLRRAFRREVTRTQRRSDGTVSIEGRRFEIPSRYRHMEKLRLRYAEWDLTTIDLVDPQCDVILCSIYPLDLAANANGARRPLDPVKPAQPAPQEGMAPLLKKLMADYAATGLPPAYIPTDTDQEPQP